MMNLLLAFDKAWLFIWRDALVRPSAVAKIVAFTTFGVSLLLPPLVQGGNMSDSFMNEIRILREKDKSQRIAINELVKKHIPNGTSRDSAINFLSGSGFKCNSRVSQKEIADIQHLGFDDAIDCVLDKTKWYLLGSGDIVRIHIFLKSGVVTAAAGEIVYSSL